MQITWGHLLATEGERISSPDALGGDMYNSKQLQEKPIWSYYRSQNSAGQQKWAICLFSYQCYIYDASEANLS